LVRGGPPGLKSRRGNAVWAVRVPATSKKGWYARKNEDTLQIKM